MKTALHTVISIDVCIAPGFRIRMCFFSKGSDPDQKSIQILLFSISVRLLTIVKISEYFNFSIIFMIILMVREIKGDFFVRPAPDQG